MASADASQATSATTASSQLTKKLQKALTLRIDSQASRDALKCLSGFFDENTVHTRRNLRSSIEGESLLLHKEFVHSFGALERQMENLDALVASLDGAVDRAAEQLKASRSETQASLERAAALRKEAVSIDLKQQVLDRFLGRFRLSEADTQLVRSGDKPLDDDFFAAFERLAQVRANARHMLSTSGQQTSGVDILHETSEVLEASYERMFVWVQQQCRRDTAVAKGTSAELETPAGSILKRVLKLLRERPVYFNHCLRDIARVRKQALQQRFLEALSQGDALGARPMELQAGDPVRFVSDMLAWIHEHVEVEQNALGSLVGREPAGATQKGEEGTMTVVSFEEMLDIALDGVAATLTAKTKQSLQANASALQITASSNSIVTVYKVAQVFSHFTNTLTKLLRKDAHLVSSCMDLHARTYQDFLDLWEAQAQKLRQGVSSVYVATLSAPPFVLESANTLQEVLSFYEMAPVPLGEREADFLPVLSAAFDPLLNHCQQVASMMDVADGQVFLMNCVSAMQAPLEKHEFTRQRQEMYKSFVEDQMKRLVEGQAKAILSKVGLSERLKALREKPPDVSLGGVPELHAVSLAATLRSFYNSLFTRGGALSLVLLERIEDLKLRQEARGEVSKLIASSYEELYNGIQELGIATHTPDQVRTLLEGV